MILIIQNELLHYRCPLYNSLAQKDQVTVLHSGKPINDPENLFNEMTLEVKKFGPFFIQKGLSNAIKSINPSVVIAMFDIRWVCSIIESFKHDKSINWVWWGLVRGKNRIIFTLKILIAKRGNSIIFYDKLTRSDFKKFLKKSDNLFVANNTYHVKTRIKAYKNTIKNRFINVGSLHPRKQNDVTIKALSNIIKNKKIDLKLTLIGNGPDKNYLLNLINDLGINDNVEIVSALNNSDDLAKYYLESIASISFGQAGLAVLQSMAFGVPFITKKNAVSGGEINNIIDNKNGIFCEDNLADLEIKILDLLQNPMKARSLGKSAYDYYSEEATIDNMVKNFKLAINYNSKN
ncbi:MAG: hypothetical protein CMP33_07215 [Rickettsiales bacterium]|nr:hypothetical protein [Rickettsiales bacterium]